ncbi:MAG: adenylyl-sulfate kinase [Spirochaetota bacterium]
MSRVSPNVSWEIGTVTREQRETKNGHPALVVWLTGLSASGKSTIARAVEQRLFSEGVSVARLDGDNVRHGLCGDLGFAHEDRAENIRRVAEVAALLHDLGHVVLCAFISPYREDRSFARTRVPEGRFLEVHVHCPLIECERRDPKGLYKKALAGEISGFTGVDDAYEEPASPELTVDTSLLDQAAAAAAVYEAIVTGLGHPVHR